MTVDASDDDDAHWYRPAGVQWEHVYDVWVTLDRRVVLVAPFRRWLHDALHLFVRAAESAADPESPLRAHVWHDEHTIVAAWPTAQHAHMLVHGRGSPLTALLAVRAALRHVPAGISCSADMCHARSQSLYGPPVRLAMATLCKQEPVRRVRVWIDHHLRLGVELVWLYDNGSSSEYRQELVDDLQAHLITQRVQLIDWPFPYVDDESGMSAQTTQQAHAVHALRSRAEWLALIDVDEFLIPMGAHADLIAALDTATAGDVTVSAVHVPCMWFGCAHCTKWTDDDFLHRLTRRSRCPAGTERDKLIVRPALTDLVCVHRVVAARGRTMRANAWRTLRFNHYYTLTSHRRHLCRCHVLDACPDTRLAANEKP